MSREHSFLGLSHCSGSYSLSAPLLQWFPSLGRDVNVVKNSVYKILKELTKMINYKTGTWKSLPS